MRSGIILGNREMKSADPKKESELIRTALIRNIAGDFEYSRLRTPADRLSDMIGTRFCVIELKEFA